MIVKQEDDTANPESVQKSEVAQSSSQRNVKSDRARRLERIRAITEKVTQKLAATVKRFDELILESEKVIPKNDTIDNISQINFEPFLKRKKAELLRRFPQRSEEEIKRLLGLELEYKKQKLQSRLNPE